MTEGSAGKEADNLGGSEEMPLPVLVVICHGQSIGRYLIRERNAEGLACEHDIEHDPARPDVCLLAIILIVKEDFRSNVIRCTTNSFGP